MRWRGIIHIASPRFISGQQAPRISLDPVAVRTSNSNASWVARCTGATDGRNGLSHIGMGKGSVVDLAGPRARKQIVENIPSGVICPVPLGNGPLHHRADAVAQSRRGLGDPFGKRSQHSEDVTGFNVGNATGAEDGVHMQLKRAEPNPEATRISPTRA